MSPEEFWTDVELIQKDLKFVQFEIQSLWEMLYDNEYIEYKDLIVKQIKEKNQKEWRFMCQLKKMEDNIANLNF